MTGIKEILSTTEAFLVIGGHAVMLHGHPRTTVDLDILVPEESMDWWQSRLEKQGWQVVHSTESFLQFAGSEGRTPIDLMMVDDATFEKLNHGSQKSMLFGIDVRVPSPAHLVALKLHALRQPARTRTEQDWADVIGLIQSCGLDPEDGDFRLLIDRYGGPKAYDRIQRRLRE